MSKFEKVTTYKRIQIKWYFHCTIQKNHVLSHQLNEIITKRKQFSKTVIIALINLIIFRKIVNLLRAYACFDERKTIYIHLV